jgi:Putative prokaryotic signal transducing protein
MHNSPNPEEKLVKIFDTEQESEAMVVRSLLQSAGIDTLERPVDLEQDLFPVGGVAILVREEDADEARQLIHEYRSAGVESTEEIREESSSEQ